MINTLSIKYVEGKDFFAAPVVCKPASEELRSGKEAYKKDLGAPSRSDESIYTGNSAFNF